MSEHLKFDHCARDAAYKCVDCDYFGENADSERVHHIKLHFKGFEFGFCYYLGKTI